MPRKEQARVPGVWEKAAAQECDALQPIYLTVSLTAPSSRKDVWAYEWALSLQASSSALARTPSSKIP